MNGGADGQEDRWLDRQKKWTPVVGDSVVGDSVVGATVGVSELYCVTLVGTNVGECVGEIVGEPR